MTKPDTPYAAPSTDHAPPPTPREKPNLPPGLRSVRVLGVLSIVFSSLAIATTVPTFLHTSDPLAELLEKAPPTLNWRKELEPIFNRLATPSVITNGMYLGMAPLLLFLGIGLVRRASWTRLPTIAWAILAIFMSAVFAILQATIQAPAYEYMVHYARERLPSGTITHHQDMMMRAGAFFLRQWWISLLLYAAYPAVLLSLMARRSVKSGLHAQERQSRG